eukprot:TCONS_00018467-protein
MDVIRSWFEVPAIAHFFHVFKNSFGLIEFDIEDFEDALFLDSAENCSSFLPDLVVQLLRGLYKTKDGLQITIENYSHYLQDLLEFRYAGRHNPVKDGDFKAITTREKVEVLYDMCNWRLEPEDVVELTKDLEAEEMRVMPVGFDEEGHQYWYFYGTRLYQEKCLNDNIADMSELSESEEKPKAQLKTKKKRGKKRKFLRKTKSGRSVKPRMEFNRESSEEDEENEEVEEKEHENESESETQSANVNLDEKPVLQPQEDNEWTLVCSTVQEWADIVEKFSNTKHKSEKVLLKGLRELNTVMPDIFVEKEKALQNKLLEMAPRRSSDRIHIKMQVREDEHRKKEQKRLLKSEMKAREAEKRLKELEKEKQKEREKRYLERERNLELRAKRAKQREEMKEVQTDPELAKQIRVKQTQSAASSFKFDLEGEEDDQFIAMEKVLEVMKDHDDSWPFLEPVDAAEAPNYYEFIKNPMDLSKIAEKIENKTYKDESEFANDVYLMLDNCEMYNGTLSPFTKLAGKIKKVFEKQMKKEFPPEMDSNDEMYVEEVAPQRKKLKQEKEKKTKSPKEAKPKKVKLESLAVFKRNNAILTPEFAHAQILQAQAQLLHKTQTDATVSQLLNKFGIPAEVLAKLTPAQMQTLMMQLRSGKLRAPGKSPKPVSTENLTPIGKPKVLKTISPKPVLSKPAGSLRMIAPKREHLSISQFIRANTTPSPGLKIDSPNTLSFRQVAQNGSLRFMATQNTPRSANFTFPSTTKLPSLHSIPPSKALPNPLFPVTAKSNAQQKTKPATSVNIAKPILNITNRPPSTLNTSTLRQQSVPGQFSQPNSNLSNTSTTPTIKPLTTSAVALRAMGVPILNQANVRYIGQPNGQLQKILYLPTQAVNKSRAVITQPLLRTQSIPVQRFITPANAFRATSPQTQQTNIPKPVFINSHQPNGPLKVASSQVLQRSISAVAQSAKESVFVKPKEEAAIPSKQNMHGLKKAVQQVAAVTNINAKLQNHLQNRNSHVPVSTIKKEATLLPEQSKPLLYKLPLNMVQVAVKPTINSPITPKTSQTATTHSTTSCPRTVATTLILSPIRAVKPVNQIPLVKGAIPASVAVNQPGISFILTSTGLVSVSLPASANKKSQATKQTIPTQNIITSNAPARLLQKGFALPLTPPAPGTAPPKGFLVPTTQGTAPPKGFLVPNTCGSAPTKAFLVPSSQSTTPPKGFFVPTTQGTTLPKGFLIPVTKGMTLTNNPAQRTITVAITQSTNSINKPQLSTQPVKLVTQGIASTAQLMLSSNNRTSLQPIAQKYNQPASLLNSFPQQVLVNNLKSQLLYNQPNVSTNHQHLQTKDVKPLPTTQQLKKIQLPTQPVTQFQKIRSPSATSSASVSNIAPPPPKQVKLEPSTSSQPVTPAVTFKTEAATTSIGTVSTTVKSETGTPSLFQTTDKKDISPEKLRDAETLLGLINPTLHASVKTDTSSTPTKSDPIHPRPSLNNTSTSSTQKPSLGTTPLLTMTIPSSPTSDKNQLKIQLPNFQKYISTEPQQAKMIISQPQQTSKSLQQLSSFKQQTQREQFSTANQQTSNSLQQLSSFKQQTQREQFSTANQQTFNSLQQLSSFKQQTPMSREQFSTANQQTSNSLRQLSDIPKSPAQMNLTPQQLQTLLKINESLPPALQKELAASFNTNKNIVQQKSQTTAKQFQPAQQRLAPFIQNLQQQQGKSLTTSKPPQQQSKQPTTSKPPQQQQQQESQKMVVDANQLIKLQQEGKVLVTPNGQMFLVANNNPTQK